MIKLGAKELRTIKPAAAVVGKIKKNPILKIVDKHR